MHVVYTGSCEWMNYMYTLWLGSTNFPKSFRPFQKPKCQKSDIKEVHNLQFRHCLGVVAHMIWKYLQYVCNLTQRRKWLSLLQSLEMQNPYAFWRLYTLKSKNVMKKIKHDILNVSKSVAWYQKNVHIKACVVMGYTPRAWRQFKMMFIPATGKVNYTQAKGYCPNSLLPFM